MTALLQKVVKNDLFHQNYIICTLYFKRFISLKKYTGNYSGIKLIISAEK